jgi:hypothetical protein
MATFIELPMDGAPSLINVDSIKTIYPQGMGTVIVFGHHREFPSSLHYETPYEEVKTLLGLNGTKGAQL